MAKVIKYRFVSCEVNNGTEEEPIMEQIVLGKFLTCPTQEAFDASYAIATKEALPGTLEVSGEFDPEPEIAVDAVTWDELNNAYQEGVDSV